MLRRVEIRNFAVVEEQALDLGPGLNVLTGETGAGKSILIEALSFLLGARGSASWLRAGAARLEVIGVFDSEDIPRETRALFKVSGPTVFIRRELDASGRTRASINAQPAPLSTLAALGEHLIDFHGQHEHQTLLEPSLQLEVLDRFGGHDAALDEIAVLHRDWHALVAERDAGQLPEEERRQRADRARFQIQEIADAKLSSGEEEELEAALPRLRNSERLRALAATAYELLYEQDPSILGGLLKAGRTLEELAKVDPAMAPVHGRLEEARLGLEETARSLEAYRDGVESDPEKLDQALGRLDLLARLKKKYGATLAEVLAFQDRVRSELERLENAEQRLGRLQADLAKAQERLEEANGRLHEARLKAARRLERAVRAELSPLGLPQARFSVSVELEEGRYRRWGGDEVEFMLAPNPGEPMKAIRAIASGGELSRVMLALKTALNKADKVPILVFDEVDAGVGGAVARAVGQKLAALGRSRQVLCVTHLPQVACFGRTHFLVAKDVNKGRTRARVEKLEGAGRLEAIALMLGGRQATAASRKHARELLESSTA